MMLYTLPECSLVICLLLSSEEPYRVVKEDIFISIFIDGEADLLASRSIALYGLTGKLKEANM